MTINVGTRVQCAAHVFRHFGIVRKILQDDYESHEGIVYVVEWDRNYHGHHNLHEYVTSDVVFDINTSRRLM